MDSPASDEYVPTFYIGQHDSGRIRVTPELLHQAQDYNYDMLTTPITTPIFRARVLTLVSNHLEELERHPDKTIPIPVIPSFSPFDTPLIPNEIVSQLLAVASPWIDLSSPDPMIYNISRQVLELEVAYAAFCGIGNVILPAPKIHHGQLHSEGITQYAHAIQEALSIGPYLQLSVSFPMMDIPEDEQEDENSSLGALARGRYMGLSEDGYEEASMELGEEINDTRTGSHSSRKAAKFDFFGTWDAWNVIRTVCKYSNRLFVALTIPPQLPPLSAQARWQSEPLRILQINKKTFSQNPKGYPAFTHYHQALLTRYMRIRQPPWLLLCDVGPIPGVEAPGIPSVIDTSTAKEDAPDAGNDPVPPTSAEASGIRRRPSQKAKDPIACLNYLRYLQHHQPPRTTLERFGAGYQDYLQAPLQPLTDNLESITYEVFEKDPVKYDQYLLAIQRALQDWRDQGKPASGADGRIIVAVAGAGRGPLVTRALEASDSTGIPIEMWALEKNPNAFVLLQRHNEETWGGRVKLVKSDMRSWKGPLRQSPPTTNQTSGYTGSWPLRTSEEPQNDSFHITESTPAPQTQTQPQPQSTSTHTPIDILISELLGSFADNELSPECLDGILPLLNRTHGLSIPSSYTAHLTPITAPKLHADISTRAATDPTAPDTPYVVMLHSVDYLSTTTSRPSGPSPTSTAEGAANALPTPIPNIQKAWSFSHGPMDPLPAHSANKHNERHARLHFHLDDRAVCHGLAGYFEAVLYPGVELSTNPLSMEVKSAGMMSWFPIFFPLKTPLYVPDSSSLTVSIFRKTDNRKVWYEWMVEAWSGGVGAGGGKRRVRLGVSEVGCSKGGGCLM